MLAGCRDTWEEPHGFASNEPADWNDAGADGYHHIF